jgi:hypothetical protein
MSGWNHGVIFVAVTLARSIRILRTYKGGRLAISFASFMTNDKDETGWFKGNEERRVDSMIYKIDKF